MVAQLDRSYLYQSKVKSLQRLLSYSLFEGRPLTTSGRWINPLVLRFLKTVASIGSVDSEVNPIYIAGSGRSGTTALGNIVSLHPDVGYLNEPKALWFTACPQEDVIGNYNDVPGLYELKESHVTPEIILRFNKLYATYQKLTVTTRVVDKYPESIFRVPFLLKIFPTAKFIFITRHGSDVCQSIALWSEAHRTVTKTGVSDWWGLNNRKWDLIQTQLLPLDERLAFHANDVARIEDPLNKAAVEWVLTMRAGIAALEQFPSAIKLIRYEDLVSSPRDVLQPVFRFCSLSECDDVIAYAEGKLRIGTSYHQIKLKPFVKQSFVETLSALGYE